MLPLPGKKAKRRSCGLQTNCLGIACAKIGAMAEGGALHFGTIQLILHHWRR
jgi:hypothetical protein